MLLICGNKEDVWHWLTSCVRVVVHPEHQARAPSPPHCRSRPAAVWPAGLPWGAPSYETRSATTLDIEAAASDTILPYRSSSDSS